MSSPGQNALNPKLRNKRFLRIAAVFLLFSALPLLFTSCVAIKDENGNFLYYDWFWNSSSPGLIDEGYSYVFGEISGSGGMFGDAVGLQYIGPNGLVNDDRNMAQDHFVDKFDSEDDVTQLVGSLQDPNEELLPFNG